MTTFRKVIEKKFNQLGTNVFVKEKFHAANEIESLRSLCGGKCKNGLYIFVTKDRKIR